MRTSGSRAQRRPAAGAHGPAELDGRPAHRWRLLRGAVAATFVAIALGGCSGSGSGTGSSEQTSTVDAAAPRSATVGQKPAAPARSGVQQAVAPLSRDVIQQASLTVRARRVGDALGQVHTLVAGVQGVVADEQTVTSRRGEPRRSTLTLRVPADSFDATLRDLAGLGRLASQQVTTEDVSTQVVDIDARVLSAERTLRRIRELMESANDFSDVLSLESELARREADLASLRAQQAYLEDQTSLSTIQLSLLPPLAPKADPGDDEPAGFVAGLGVGWDALVGLVTVVLTALGVVVPLLLVMAPVALAGWLLLRRVLRRPTQPAQPPAS